MKIKDKIRFFYAKFFLKKTLLFSSKKEWEWDLRKRVSGYVSFFYEFDEVNPNHFDVILPLTLFAQKHINTHHELFARQIYLSPADSCIELCDDKEKFHAYLSRNGFQQLLPSIGGKLDYPYVLKKKRGTWGDGIYIISSKKVEMEHINKIESDEYFIQQYIKGKDEYTAHIIIANKEIVFFKVLKFTFQDEYFIKGKDFKSTSVEEIEHSQYKSIFGEILSSMNYEGISCFNYKITDEGLSIFEVNPRFGASMNRFINEALICYRIYGQPNKKSLRQSKLSSQ